MISQALELERIELERASIKGIAEKSNKPTGVQIAFRVRERALGDRITEDLVGEDSQGRAHLDPVSRHPGVPFLFVPVKPVVKHMEEYVIRPQEPATTVVELGILLGIALAPADLGHLPLLRDLFKVLLLEGHRQLVKVEAGVEAVHLVARVQ